MRGRNRNEGTETREQKRGNGKAGFAGGVSVDVETWGADEDERNQTVKLRPSSERVQPAL